MPTLARASRVFAAVLVALPALAGAACSNVIGAGDYQVGVAPDSAGDGGVSSGGKLRGAGQSLCTSACGGGLTCVKTQYGPSGLCTYACTDDTGCEPTHSCIGSSNPADDFPSSCLQTCASSACASGFVCLHLDDGSASCFPRDWALGIGDPCTSPGDCASGVCLNAPSGWCSRACLPGDACAGDYPDQVNSQGEKNACSQVKGSFMCAPGCELDSSCALYGDASCQRLVSGASVCLP